jgi:hypothetical protein
MYSAPEIVVAAPTMGIANAKAMARSSIFKGILLEKREKFQFNFSKDSSTLDFFVFATFSTVKNEKITFSYPHINNATQYQSTITTNHRAL